MTEIKCQAKHSDTGGCYTCGGFGYIICQTKCENCGHEYWIRPGCYTVYEGKVWTSVDGVQVTYHKDKSTCQFCEVNK